MAACLSEHRDTVEENVEISMGSVVKSIAKVETNLSNFRVMIGNNEQSRWPAMAEEKNGRCQDKINSSKVDGRCGKSPRKASVILE